MINTEKIPHSITFDAKLNDQSNIIGIIFKSFDDEFIISLNIYTFEWELQVIEKAYYNSYFFDSTINDELSSSFYYKNSFSDIAKKLEDIIYDYFDYEIQHNANRWFSYIPAWAYLKFEYLHPSFVRYVSEYIKSTLEGLNQEEILSDEEKRTLEDLIKRIEHETLATQS